MTQPEPILRAEDHRAWDQWMRAVRLHRHTRQHANAVDHARRLVARAMATGSRPAISLSGGKDSSALTHLVAVTCGAKVDVISEKDDLDYPGEEAYVRALAERCGVPITIVRPEVSPATWIAQRAAYMSGGEDVHGRNAGLSKACFYGVMERAGQRYDVAFWGLRAEESGRRKSLLEGKGCLYTLKAGGARCHPLGWWRGIDVYAYLETHGIELLPVYRCIGFLPEHRREPWRLRKSWWLPGAHAAHGQVAWLRRYWPSLWDRYLAWFPDARSFV